MFPLSSLLFLVITFAYANTSCNSMDMDQGPQGKFSPQSWSLSTLKNIVNKWQNFMVGLFLTSDYISASPLFRFKN